MPAYGPRGAWFKPTLNISTAFVQGWAISSIPAFMPPSVGMAELKTATASPLAVRRCYGREAYSAHDWPKVRSAYRSGINVSSDWSKSESNSQ
ncbi:hypothetical protein CSKR_108889 [Clonorchis sinensis]|uniref:Uncharacterized protein n=1 Tax=Clonorchis sinensis TaxID=79923 RepID=A0A3R7GQC8_CLOSI|nr:hypothetical protein CSKR_108889 [Clonorchis sinensis]